MRKVIRNRGRNTPGVDKQLWNTVEDKTQAIERLKKGGYKSQPLRRVYMPKANGKMRPLSIPCMIDRAMQALHAMALDPISETKADPRSYGFRKYRSTFDAIDHAKRCLTRKTSARFILEADIKGFFDNVSHEWVMKHIPMNKKILKEFLKAGLLDKAIYHETTSGVPQGGIISPIIANMVLDGIEQTIQQPIDGMFMHKFKLLRIHISRYADDFIVTASSKEVLTDIIIPRITEFLKERGLALNLEKTKITSIEEGFDFLGFNLRRVPALTRANESKKLLLITPSTQAKAKFRTKVKKVIKDYKSQPTAALISKLNPIILGWGNYYRTAMSKTTFTKMDHFIWSQVWKWCLKRHPTLGVRNVKKIYFLRTGRSNWNFSCKTETGNIVTLFKMASICIRPHVEPLNKNPFILSNLKYFEGRRNKSYIWNFPKALAKIIAKTKGICKLCNEPLLHSEELDVHHIHPIKLGGKNNISNLIVLHSTCHKQVTYTKDPLLIARHKELGLIKP